MEDDLKKNIKKNEDDIKKTKTFLDSSLIKGQTFPGIGSALLDFLFIIIIFIYLFIV
jgi:hypothetical protein